MIDNIRLKAVLAGYKAYFPGHWKYECHKWEAVQHFQKYWDIDASDFEEMFKKATEKTYNLLASGYAYPRRMIQNFAKADGETVRQMFRMLFNESYDLAERIRKFQDSAEEMRMKYDDGSWHNHYQNTNAISTYLWLMYPDKYYVYRYEIYRDVASELKSEYHPKKNGSTLSLLGGYQLYDELCEKILEDEEPVELFKATVTENYYSDPKMKTVTMDVGFYLSRFYLPKQKAGQKNTSVKPIVKSSTQYTKHDFLNEVFMTEERYDILEALLRNKKNIILQGAPGVGKTFAAKRLAYAMMGEIEDSRIEFVQFHQNYSYEDFVLGYRPDGEGFKLMEGIFYRFCQKAADEPDKEYFFIIDEINRGNLSKILGELMMAIEKEYRGTKITLAYNGRLFSVPENLYIIGMMNTADRSLAMIDYALRRRFSFFEMEPGFNSDGFQNYQNTLSNEIFNMLIDQIKILNKEIAQAPSLGRGFRIGHSYFCGRKGNDCTTDWMRAIVKFDILPMLAEYWFDEPTKLQQWEKNLRGVFEDE